MQIILVTHLFVFSLALVELTEIQDGRHVTHGLNNPVWLPLTYTHLVMRYALFLYINVAWCADNSVNKHTCDQFSRGD